MTTQSTPLITCDIPMSHRNTATLSLIALLAVPLALAGCDRERTVTPLTDREVQQLTEDQPQIFVETQNTLTLEGIEDLYLGQDYDEAMNVLDDYCERIMTYDGGWRHSDAVFKGCIIDEGTHYKTIRAGFWPFRDDELSTLEIEDRVIEPDVVRARFTELSDRLTEDLPRGGLLMMASPDYRLIANWDDGTDEPAHITIGFPPP